MPNNALIADAELLGHVCFAAFYTSSIQVSKLENYGTSKSTEGPRSSNSFSLAIPFQSSVIEPCEWDDKCQIEGKQDLVCTMAIGIDMCT